MLNSLSQYIYELVSKSLGERTTKAIMLYTSWKEVMGAELSQYVTLLRIIPHHENPDKFTIYIETLSPLATQVQHQIPQILERINNFFGENTVQRVHIKQKTWNPKPRRNQY